MSPAAVARRAYNEPEAKGQPRPYRVTIQTTLEGRDEAHVRQLAQDLFMLAQRDAEVVAVETPEEAAANDERALKFLEAEKAGGG